MKDQLGGKMKIIKKLKYSITIILLIIIFTTIIYIKFYLTKNKYDDIDIVENTLQVEQTLENNIKENIIVKYNIDIKGAVQKPGVYNVDSNLTINDVIKIAGGLTKEADTSLINLAKKITDEMVIIVYTKEEVKNSNLVNTVIKVVEKECVCPNIENDGCLNNEIEDNISNNPKENLININTATKEELLTVSGIGESKANNIIKYREEVGRFNTIEDIKNVEGIGEKLYESIKIYITT